MKAVFGIAVLAVLLVAASPCFALWGTVSVSRERAKELGMEVRSTAAGSNQVRVELEFKIEGKLKDFSRVVLRIGEGDNPLLTAPLREDRSKPGLVAVSFTADLAQLDKLTLQVMVLLPPGGIRYEIRVKDFVELDKLKHGKANAEPNKVGLKILSAEKLTRAFHEDAGSTRVAVEGVVKEVLMNKNGEVVLYLKGTTDRLGIACSFDIAESKSAAKLRVGDRIEVLFARLGMKGSCLLMPANPIDGGSDLDLLAP